MGSPVDISVMPLLELVIYILLFVFIVHALVLAYHWFSYGTNRNTATTALTLYLGGGAVFFVALFIALPTLG